MQGFNSECGKKENKQKYLKNRYVCCVKIWKAEFEWLTAAFDNKINEWYVMQGWNGECGKKVKKQKNRKNNYVCCVKNWKLKYDWMWVAWRNKKKK
jgi:hypothetical protein